MARAGRRRHHSVFPREASIPVPQSEAPAPDDKQRCGWSATGALRPPTSVGHALDRFWSGSRWVVPNEGWTPRRSRSVFTGRMRMLRSRPGRVDVPRTYIGATRVVECRGGSRRRPAHGSRSRSLKGERLLDARLATPVHNDRGTQPGHASRTRACSNTNGLAGGSSYC